VATFSLKDIRAHDVAQMPILKARCAPSLRHAAAWFSASPPQRAPAFIYNSTAM
jgi:hypothetical protein